MTTQPIAGALRAAIEESGLSNYAIAKRTGVSKSALSRFWLDGTLRLESAEKLAVYFGLELVPKAGGTAGTSNQTKRRRKPKT